MLPHTADLSTSGPQTAREARRDDLRPHEMLMLAVDDAQAAMRLASRTGWLLAGATVDAADRAARWAADRARPPRGS